MFMPLNSSQRKQFSTKSYHFPPPPKSVRLTDTERTSVAPEGAATPGHRDTQRCS